MLCEQSAFHLGQVFPSPSASAPRDAIAGRCPRARTTCRGVQADGARSWRKPRCSCNVRAMFRKPTWIWPSLGPKRYNPNQDQSFVPAGCAQAGQTPRGWLGGDTCPERCWKWQSRPENQSVLVVFWLFLPLKQPGAAQRAATAAALG